jgi:hypothetical protein
MSPSDAGRSVKFRDGCASRVRMKRSIHWYRGHFDVVGNLHRGGARLRQVG